MMTCCVRPYTGRKKLVQDKPVLRPGFLARGNGAKEISFVPIGEECLAEIGPIRLKLICEEDDCCYLGHYD